MDVPKGILSLVVANGAVLAMLGDGKIQLDPIITAQQRPEAKIAMAQPRQSL
jgi:hypothetical protein